MNSKPVQLLSPILGMLIVLLFVLLPFAVSDALVRPEQTAKTFGFLYALASIAPLFAIYQLWGKEQSAIRIIMIDIVLAGLLGYLLVSRYVIQDMSSFSLRFYELLGLAVLYVIIRRTDAKYYPWFMLALVAGGLLQAVYGNLQLYGYYPSRHPNFALTGSFFNPGPYAGFLAAVFPVALGIWLFRDRLFTTSFGRRKSGNAASFEKPIRFLNTVKQNKIQTLIAPWFALGAVVAITLVLPPTQSRAAILAVITGAAYLLCHRYDLQRIMSTWLNTPLKKSLSLALLVVILTVGLTVTYWVKKDSADGRILVWQVTGQMIQSHPVTGVGYDLFKAEYMNTQADWFRNHPDSPYAGLADNTKYAFNDFLQFTVEQGLVGLALLSLLGFFIIRMDYTVNTVWMVISKAGILTIVVFGLFSYPAQILPIKISLTLFLAVIASYGRSYTIRLPSASRWTRWGIKAIVILFFVWGSIQASIYIYQLHNATKQWKSGLDLYYLENMEQSLNEYELAYSVFHRNGEFLMNYGKALSMAEADSKAVKILGEAKQYLNNIVIQTALGDSYKNMKNYKNAEQAYQLAAEMLPDRFYPQYLLVKLYDKSGQREKLIPIAEKLLDKDPKIPSTAVEEIKQEVEQILTAYQTGRL